MKSIFFLLLLCLLAFTANASPSRIVSANLCADQLLLQLADKSQIRAITNMTRDPGLSYFLKEADGIDSVRGSLESLLPLKPDLVLLGPGRMENAVERTLQSLNINVLRVGMPNTIKEIEEQIRSVAAAIGQEKRGKALIARMQSQLIQSRLETKRLDYTPRIAFLYNGGYAEGRGGLTQDMLNFIGLENMVQTQQDATLSLETIVTDTPDLIVQSQAPLNSGPALGNLRTLHPAMQQLSESSFLFLPPAMTICGNNLIAEVGKDIVTHLLEAEPKPAQVGMLQ